MRIFLVEFVIEYTDYNIDGERTSERFMIGIYSDRDVAYEKAEPYENIKYICEYMGSDYESFTAGAFVIHDAHIEITPYIEKGHSVFVPYTTKCIHIV